MVDQRNRPVGIVTVHDLARIALAVDAAGGPHRQQTRWKPP